MSNKNNLQKKLNLNYTWLTSQVYKEGPYDIPILQCKDDYVPDFIALYSEIGLYHKTKYTTICFHQNDNVFNGINGLCNAVYYDNKARLNYFKDRFADCHYFIMPDCSLTYDQDTWDIIFRTALMRLTCLWFTFELPSTLESATTSLSTKLSMRSMIFSWISMPMMTSWISLSFTELPDRASR